MPGESTATSCLESASKGIYYSEVQSQWNYGKTNIALLIAARLIIRSLKLIKRQINRYSIHDSVSPKLQYTLLIVIKSRFDRLCLLMNFMSVCSK